MSLSSGVTLNPFRWIGNHLIRFVEEAGRIMILFVQTLGWTFRPPLQGREILKQMEEVGVRSFPVVVITAGFTGMVLALQSFTGFKRFGAETMVGTVVALSVTRELGPVLTGLMVSGRVGSAMAAELGTMRVTEQIDALYTLATNPIKYLIVPRFLAAVDHASHSGHFCRCHWNSGRISGERPDSGDKPDPLFSKDMEFFGI